MTTQLAPDLLFAAARGDEPLATAIRAKFADLRNARRSYGHTKTTLRRARARRTLHQLEGLLYAWYLTKTGAHDANFASQAQAGADYFGINLAEEARAVDRLPPGEYAS